YRYDAVAAENLTLVTETLAAAGVDHVLLSTHPIDQRVVVQVGDVDRVLAALAGRDDRPLQAGWGSGRPYPVARLPRRRAGERVLRVFEFAGTVGGELLAGPELACAVELWDEIGADGAVVDGEAMPPGGLVAPVPNRWASAITPDTARRIAEQPHLFSVSYPVDAVFTWVDGDDPAWRRAKDRALRATGAPVCEPSTSPARFTSR